MKNILLQTMLLCFLLLMTSCRIKRHTIYTYEPTTGQISQQNERKLAVLNMDSLQVALALDHYSSQEIAFDVLIKNKSTKEWTVDLSSFFISAPPTTASMEKKAICYALNPEKQADKIANEKQVDIPRKFINQTFNSCLNLIPFLGVAVLTDGRAPGIDQVDLTKPLIKTELIKEGNSQTTKEDKLAYWQNFALRSGTLRAEQQLVGKVYFNLKVDDSSYVLNFKVGNTPIQAVFTKVSIASD